MPKDALPLSHHEGLGDTLGAVFSFVGVKEKPGCGCSQRKKLLNGLIPYKLLAKAKCFTPEEFEEWSEFRRTRTLKISIETAEWVSRLYSRIFSVPFYQPQRCCPRPVIDMIEKLDHMHDKNAKENGEESK